MELLDFASTFVYTARMCVDEGTGLTKSIFTSRQSTAIGSLGTARILRTRDLLGVKDLVNLAIITSPPKAQKFAEMIAFRILLGDERDVFTHLLTNDKSIATNETGPDPFPMQLQHNPKVVSQLDLDHILKLLELEHTVDHEENSKLLDFINEVEKLLFQNQPQNNLEWAQKRISFDKVGGRQGIADKQIMDWDQLFDEASLSIKRSIPFIQPEDLVDAMFMDKLSEVQELSNEGSVVSMAEIINQLTKSNPDFTELDQLSQRGLSQIDKLIKSIINKSEHLHLDPDQHTPGLHQMMREIRNRLRDDIYTIQDMLKQPQLFRDGIDYDSMQDLIQHSMKTGQDILELLQQATELDDILHTNFSDQIAKKGKHELASKTLDELLDTPSASTAWLEEVLDRLEDLDKQSYDEVWEHKQKLSRSRDNVSNPYLREELQQFIRGTLSDQIKLSQIPAQLEQSVEWARKESIAFKASSIKQKGEELGMSREAIAKLIGDAFEIIQMMIQGEDPSFERMRNIIPHASLNNQEKKELVKTSIDVSASGALAGFLDNDFQLTMNQIGNSKHDQMLMEEAIGAGAGENLLKEWFLHGSNMPPWMRQLVKQVAKQVLIEQGKKRAAMLLGSSEAGPLPEGSIRPYILGDDPDAIDLEESLENILSLGKTIKQVSVDDLIVRKAVTGRRCVIFLIDISGSMNGKPLASAAMATVMLLYAFARDELGIALFESNTHVICEINKPVDIDEIADQILDLTARGGTQMQAALGWAEKQFVKSKSEDKMFVMMTDAMIGDFRRSEQHFRNIADQGATSVLCIPQSGYGRGPIQSIVESANAQLVTVKDWQEFPEQISKILSRS